MSGPKSIYKKVKNRVRKSGEEERRKERMRDLREGICTERSEGKAAYYQIFSVFQRIHYTVQAIWLVVALERFKHAICFT